MALSQKNIVLVVVIVGVAFAAVSLRNRMAESPPAQQDAAQPQAARILIAKHDLTVGSFVQGGGQDLDWGPVPESVTAGSEHKEATGSMEGQAQHDSYLYEGAVKLSDFNGAAVRRTLHAGDPVTQSALMKSGEGGFMSAVLEPGKRAVSIAVNATSGNAGFVSPGDHVDLLVTHHVKTMQGASGSDDVVVSDTFVHDVRIVAVDQMLDNPENKAILAKTVTVEVTPREAEQIAIATELGKISLALRSLPAPEKAATDAQSPDKKLDNVAATGTAENANAPTKPEDEHTTQLKDLYGAENAKAEVNPVDNDPSLTSSHKSTIVPRVIVIRGDKTENIDFYQGK